MSFFICKLGRDPIKAYASDSGRSGSGSSSSGASVHGAGLLTFYRPNMNFNVGGPSYEDLRRVDRFDNTSTFIDQLDFILDLTVIDSLGCLCSCTLYQSVYFV